ncbi:MAG: branched-chain amino acid ABC transporter permease [Geminicoccaceae bacterium]
MAAALLLVATTGCAPSEVARERICEQALRALEPQAALVQPGEPGPPDTVRLRYRLATGEFDLACRFVPRGLQRDGLDLAGVTLGSQGELTPAVLFLLKTYGLGRRDTASTTTGLTKAAYFVQQLINALAPAAIYALLATGYALIYGLTGRINLAFGEFTTVGAYAALSGILLAGSIWYGGVGAMVAAGLGVAAATGAALGVVFYGLIFAALQRRGTQALLIATIGLAIALGEALRLLSGSRQRWLQPFFTQPWLVGTPEQGQVVVNAGQLLLALIALATVVAVVLVLQRTTFGRAYRACADDAEAAAMMGVDVARTVRTTCMLGSLLAGVAGFVIATHYGIVSFSMGALWGFKALTAAVVGGIGSVSGAALGGVLIGLLESLWAGYLPSAYKEVAVFGLLALMLALRPNGLFGTPGAVENPGLWRGRPQR